MYIPYTGITINNQKGEQVLLEALIANGPAYKIVVHENEEWYRIQEEDELLGDWIEIIPKKESDTIKKETEDFFKPAIEGMMINDPNYKFSIPADNAIRGLKKALSYIVIANRYKAWIYSDDIIKEAQDEIKWFQQYQNQIPKEGLKRISTFNDFFSAYQYNNIEHLMTINNPDISQDFYKFMDIARVKELSEIGYSFGVISHNYNILKRDIKSAITDILKNKSLSYITNGIGIIASIQGDKTTGIFTGGIGLLSHSLRNLDLKEYAPPIKKENVFLFPNDVQSVSNKIFNNEFKVYLENKRKVK